MWIKLGEISVAAVPDWWGSAGSVRLAKPSPGSQPSPSLGPSPAITRDLLKPCQTCYNFKIRNTKVIASVTTALALALATALALSTAREGEGKMACFIVPGTEAIVASIVKKLVKDKPVSAAGSAPASAAGSSPKQGRLSLKTKLSWLTNMLWGGALLLALEHIWHGEVVFYPPFLTAMSDPADTALMLQEMGTVGVGMAVLVTVAWLVLVLVADNVSAIRSVLASRLSATGTVEAAIDAASEKGA